MNRIYVGIDPGLTGAIAIIYGPNGALEFHDTPTLALGKKNDYNLPEMAQILRRIKDCGDQGMKVLVGLEKVHSMPEQGVVSSFCFGGGFRAWEMGLACFEIPYELVTPQAWKGTLMKGRGKEKDASRQVAMQLFPSAIPRLGLKKYHGRADALLIAEFIRRTAF